MAENRPMASLDGARILHLSADFPDPLVPGKTRAVARLLDLVAEADHRVYSLNRVGGAPGIAALPFGPAVPGPPGRHVTDRAHRALAYAAPPYGLWLKTRMTAVAGAISADLAARGWRPDIVHAHKLSVEGLAGWALARRFAAPLIVSSQGNSDLKILGAKATLRPAWRRIWQSADWILPFAPWTAAALDERLLAAVDGVLARAAGLVAGAVLVRARWQDGSDGTLLAILSPAPGAEPALARAVAEALRFSGLGDDALDLTFLPEGDPLAERLGRVGVRIALPRPEPPAPPSAPGSDPARPPILRR